MHQVELTIELRTDDPDHIEMLELARRRGASGFSWGEWLDLLDDRKLNHVEVVEVREIDG